MQARLGLSSSKLPTKAQRHAQCLPPPPLAATTTTSSQSWSQAPTGTISHPSYPSSPKKSQTNPSFSSGLGLGTCIRLIDDFLTLHPSPHTRTLNLLFTTRSPAKNAQTLRSLQTHLTKAHSRKVSTRVELQGLSLELTDLLSVRQLASILTQRGQRIDAAVWNAGIGGWTGINWPRAVWTICTDLVYATTFPSYQYGDVGVETKPQSGSTTAAGGAWLGQVFTANVFGHYMLTHWLAPVLGKGSRVVWTSSVSAREGDWAGGDLQGLRTDRAYESSKRLTDMLVLSSELPATRPWVESFLPASAASNGSDHEGGNARPKMFVTHPGICGTSISDIPSFLTVFVTLAFYLARLLGSPWHNIQPYKGASSTVACVLSPPTTKTQGTDDGLMNSPIPSIASAPASIVESERRVGKGKWGSSCGWDGKEAVVRTEAEGWGFGGKAGVGVEEIGGGGEEEIPPPGSMLTHMPRGTRARNREAREDFEESGREVWKAMEALRVEWEERIRGGL